MLIDMDSSRVLPLTCMIYYTIYGVKFLVGSM